MAPGGIGVTISKKHVTNYLLNLKAVSKGGYMGLIVVKVLDISYIINYVVIFIHKICIGNASHASYNNFKNMLFCLTDRLFQVLQPLFYLHSAIFFLPDYHLILHHT